MGMRKGPTSAQKPLILCPLRRAKLNRNKNQVRAIWKYPREVKPVRSRCSIMSRPLEITQRHGINDLSRRPEALPPARYLIRSEAEMGRPPLRTDNELNFYWIRKCAYFRRKDNACGVFYPRRWGEVVLPLLRGRSRPAWLFRLTAGLTSEVGPRIKNVQALTGAGNTSGLRSEPATRNTGH